MQKQDNSLKRAIIDADLIARCDNALARLRGTHTSTVRQELLSNIHGSRSRPRPAKRQKVVWKHKFYCLASVDSTQVPLKEYYKDALFRAGLREKDIQFHNLDASPEEFREVIFDAYPKLKEGGGYQFLKCVANSRNLECLSTLTMSSPVMLKKRVGNARTYIRPLQRDLDITESNDSSTMETVSIYILTLLFVLVLQCEIVETRLTRLCCFHTQLFEPCLKCDELFPIAELPEHIKNCGM